MIVKINTEILYSDLLFNDKGEFQLPPYYSDYSSSFWQYYYAKDLDGDGDSDLILSFGDVAEDRETEVFYRPVILENMGDGTLKKYEITDQQYGQSYPREAVFADFNLDGRVDVLVVGHGYDMSDNLEKGFEDRHLLYLSNNNGGYTDSSSLLEDESGTTGSGAPTQGFTHSVAADDINGDNYPDIYIGNAGGSETKLYINKQGKSFESKALPPEVFSLFADNSNTYLTVLFVDYDNDNIKELILGGNGTITEGAYIIEQDGEGNFSKDDVKKTRGILEATFSVRGKMLSIFANHWPSQANPNKTRFLAANVLMKAIKNYPNPYIVAGDFNTEYNEGAITVSADGSMYVYTACDRVNSIGGCDLYIRQYSDENGWTKEYNLGTNVNSKMWESQACFSPDGKYLYFISSRNGGEGQEDIWRSEITKEGFLKAENLGSSINTSKSEMSPFLHPDNLTLYFASEGHVGMGSDDLFLSRRTKTDEQWNTPKNMGFPINTHNSENSLIVASDGKTAYYTSDKSGYGQEDIFVFELPKLG